jgi:hypothetical protein
MSGRNTRVGVELCKLESTIHRLTLLQIGPLAMALTVFASWAKIKIKQQV